MAAAAAAAAASSSFKPFPLKTISVASSPRRQRQLSLSPPTPATTATTTTISSILPPSKKRNHDHHGGVSVDFLKGSGRPSSVSAFRARAVTDDDEWGREAAAAAEESSGGVATVEVAEGEGGEPSEIDNLKKSLKELLYGTDRGLKASSETRAEVVELITQLEAKNPTPAPTEALTLLNGKWILAYTSFSQLFPLLAMGRVPQLVKVEEISQTIDSEAFTVQNSVQFAGPLATTSLTTNAKFEVRSPKRVQIKFEEGIIGTPQLTDSIVVPEKVEFFGQNIDLSPFKGVITSVQDAASSVARTISGQPPLKIPITNTNAQSWLLTTYLDGELRISRGDGGSVFVLIKEGSSLLD